MERIEYILWAYYLVMPVYVLLTHEKEKQAVLDNQLSRLSVYGSAMLFLWLPTFVLLMLIYLTPLSLDSIMGIWKWDWVNVFAIGVLLVIFCYFCFDIKGVVSSNEKHAKLAEEMEFVRWLSPTTPKEAKYFIFGVSVTAGVCEELLFRGYLLNLLAQYMPMYAAVILSSIAFGLPHLYQGVFHIIRTAILGALLAIIYLITDSLLVPIVLHAMLNMYGGALSYYVFREKSCEEVVIQG